MVCRRGSVSPDMPIPYFSENPKMIKRLILPATLFLSLSARAECIYPAFDFFPERGGAVVVDIRVTGGTSCTHNFAEGPGYKFTSAAIERRPEHGTLKKEGAFRYVYRPDADFKGKDAYLVKICATKGDAKGCSMIAYVITLD
jgi:hypothetical protein